MTNVSCQTKLLQFLVHEGAYVDVYNLADKLFFCLPNTYVCIFFPIFNIYYLIFYVLYFLTVHRLDYLCYLRCAVILYLYLYVYM